jgi:two-component system, NarL family, response regulator NreC
MPTIVLADDHNLVREGIRALLEKEPEFKVVGEANNGLVVADLVAQLQPDVLVVDLMMPGLPGTEVARQVTQRCPCTEVIVLSMHSDEVHVTQALANRANAYLLKESTTEELVEAIHAVLAGQQYLSVALSRRAIEAYIRMARENTTDPYSDLTSREREIFQLVVEGNTNLIIAEKLYISSRTVEVHRANIMRKLGLRSLPELIRYAFARGLLPPEA